MKYEDFHDTLFDLIQVTTFNRVPDDIIRSAQTMLALAISLLPPDERQEELQRIEGGALRQHVARFPGRPAAPYPRVTNGHVAH